MPIKVRVQNFQSLEDVSLTIDGFTVVTGTNNAGKSALFRAIQGVFTNTPGTNFVRHGSNHSSVELQFDENHTVVWEKGNKVNRYVINGKVFDNVGAGTPLELTEFGVNPVTLQEQKFWPQIAPQLRGVNFLLDKPGSVLAEAIADVDRVNQLNRALKLCDSDRKKAKGDLRVRRDDAKELQQKLTHYHGLDTWVEKISQVEARKTKLEKMMALCEELTTLKGRRDRARLELDALEGVDSLSVPSENQPQKIREVKQRLLEIRELSKRLSTARQVVNDAKDVPEISIPDMAKAQKAQKIKHLLDECLSLRTRLRNAQIAQKDADTQVAASQSKLDQALAEIASMFDGVNECPTCGQILCKE